MGTSGSRMQAKPSAPPPSAVQAGGVFFFVVVLPFCFSAFPLLCFASLFRRLSAFPLFFVPYVWLLLAVCPFLQASRLI